jgi:hypothetical protein
MANYYFTPPTVDETPAGGPPLFDRYKLARGISVLRTNGVYSSFRYPSQTQVLAAEDFIWVALKTLLTKKQGML